MAKIIIIYATTGGNTEIVCQKVKEVLQSSSHSVTLSAAEIVDASVFKDFDLTILASPTYGHGVLEPDMIPFFKEFKKQDLSNIKAAVIGLGDSKYEIHYMFKSAEILEEGLKNSGANIILESLKINKSPIPYLDTRVTDWANQLSAKL